VKAGDWLVTILLALVVLGVLALTGHAQEPPEPHDWIFSTKDGSRPVSINLKTALIFNAQDYQVVYGATDFGWAAWQITADDWTHMVEFAKQRGATILPGGVKSGYAARAPRPPGPVLIPFSGNALGGISGLTPQ
jgi:hypothetical protein